MSTTKPYELHFSWKWLAPKYWGTWLVALLLVILAFVPVKLRDALAKRLANSLFDLKPLVKRRAIADTNLKLCFPDWTPKQRRDLMQKNVQIFIQLIFSVGERSVRSKSRFFQRLHVEGAEHLELLVKQQQKIIILLPHTYAVDYAGLYTCALGIDACTMFKNTGNPLIDWAVAKQRTRFGGDIYERSAGIRVLIKAIRRGQLCLYLPDEDFGPKQSIMTPFFATDKATLPALGKMASLTKAKILPVYAAYDQQLHKNKLTILPPLENFPSTDVERDTIKMNQSVEQLIMHAPEQYMWSLKLLKTVKGSEKARY